MSADHPVVSWATIRGPVDAVIEDQHPPIAVAGLGWVRRNTGDRSDSLLELPPWSHARVKPVIVTSGSATETDRSREDLLSRSNCANDAQWVWP